ncbi:hypothetical protein C8Q70DRAFT_595941 [Cubamyces menziesii]|nr:hypothetical protein C8Q70DRAFT_595941 [Cubamyces menziesii]
MVSFKIATAIALALVACVGVAAERDARGPSEHLRLPHEHHHFLRSNIHPRHRHVDFDHHDHDPSSPPQQQSRRREARCRGEEEASEHCHRDVNRHRDQYDHQLYHYDERRAYHGDEDQQRHYDVDDDFDPHDHCCREDDDHSYRDQHADCDVHRDRHRYRDWHPHGDQHVDRVHHGHRPHSYFRPQDDGDAPAWLSHPAERWDPRWVW